jgi:acyl-CoA oxidase
MARWTLPSLTSAPSGPPGTMVDASALKSSALGVMLQPYQRALRGKVLDLFREAVFRPQYGVALADERAKTWAQIHRLGELGYFEDTVASKGDARFRAAAKYDAVMSVVALLDHSLEVKIGVSMGLFGTTVRRLGNEDQFDRYLPSIENLSEFGCFALTELGHGSNVRGIETTATYDPKSETFTLHTPTESAQKYWIGGAAESATLSTVFAQLIIGKDNKGIHAFVVRLRDKPGGPPLDGISIEDCGVKAGLNGVDNGRIWFDRVRVPRTDLLCGQSAVAPDGTYMSEHATSDARFGAALAALTGGRVAIAVNAVNTAKIGLAIAVKYSLNRRAFAPKPGEQEVTLMTYSSHHRRLMIPLATTYVLSLCGDDLRMMWGKCMATSTVSKDVHVLSAGFKAIFTWFMADALQHARESCGGQGYKSENRISLMRADRDVMVSFEGANDVMMQQVAKALLSEYARTGEVMGAAVTKELPGGDDGSVTSVSFLRNALAARELKSVQALAAKMAKLVKVEGKSGFDAWNDSLNVAHDAATAHIERRIFDMHQMHLASKRVIVDAAVASALRLCGETWALSVVDADPSFLRLGCLSAAQAAEMHETLPALCARMVGISSTLVDGFELPPHMLAPIAFDYVSHNARARL